MTFSNLGSVVSDLSVKAHPCWPRHSFQAPLSHCHRLQAEFLQTHYGGVQYFQTAYSWLSGSTIALSLYSSLLSSAWPLVHMCIESPVQLLTLSSLFVISPSSIDMVFICYLQFVSWTCLLIVISSCLSSRLFYLLPGSPASALSLRCIPPWYGPVAA